MERRIVRATGAAFAAALFGWACWGLIRISKCWGTTASEGVRELPGDELLPLAGGTTYAITIAVPPQEVWQWLVQIGRGRGGLYTYTAIERLLGADISNLDRIDPSLQTLKPGDRIWMTPETYLGRLPGQFWGGTRGAARASTRSGTKTARELPARHLVIGAGAISRRHDSATGPAPQ